jgi:hypothetical protein
MGLFDAILGNASEVEAHKIAKKIEPIMFDGEVIERAFKVVRDMYVFTNARLILIDKQGMTGKKVSYLTIPYKSISTFSVETAGHFDMDSELSLWVSGRKEPIKKELAKGCDIVGIQKTLARKILS